MNLPFQITLNSILMVMIGLVLMVFGGWLITHPGFRVDGAGFFFTGIGNILFGITNGFTDMTSTGRLLYRLALVAYIAGLPLVAYFLLKQIF
jgi:hypothetical protein